MEFLKRTFSEKVLILISILAIGFTLYGVSLSNNTLKSIFINLGTSFIVIIFTVALIENNRAVRIEKTLAPTRANALEEIRDQIGFHIQRLYNLVGEEHFRPVAGALSEKYPRPNEEAEQNEWFYGFLGKVLDELNKDTNYAHLGAVTEIQYIEVYKSLDTLKEDIEKVKLQFSFGLDLELNKRILVLEKMLKPKGTVYSLEAFTAPQNNPISNEGRKALARIITAASETFSYASKLAKSYELK